MKRQKRQKQYPKEIEAAYYALNRFVSPYDYVVRFTGEEGRPITTTVNPNCIIAGRLSKLSFFKPLPVTKSNYVRHFDRDELLFYKSNPNSPYFTGYGRYDSDALKLSFADNLQITSKKKTDRGHNILLVGIDIDCHNYEQHVGDVEALIRHYLPHTYWEPSTGGQGRHGYLKLKFKNSYGVINTISSTLKKLFAELETLKKLYGFQAHIDDPAGLPLKLECVYENPYETDWKTLHHGTGKDIKFLGRYINPDSPIWQSYCSYVINDTIYHIHSDCRRNPNLLPYYLSQDEIESSFSTFYNQHINLFSPAKCKFLKINVQRAFKLPLFGATDTLYQGTLPQMEFIQQFHFLPYLTSSDLQTAYHNIKQAVSCYPQSKILLVPTPIVIDSNSCYIYSPEYASSHMDVSHLSAEEDPIPIKEGYQPPTEPVSGPETGNSENIFSQKKEKKRKSNNCVYTTQENFKNKSKEAVENITQTYAEIINWEECKETEQEFDIQAYWKMYHQHHIASTSSRYEEIVETLKTEDDTFKRTSLYIQAYIQKLKYIPTVDDAEIEYVRVGLNRNSQPTTHNRRNRIKSCLEFYAQEYDASKTGFVSSWEQDCNNIINRLTPYFKSEELKYTQGGRSKGVLLEELAFVYYCIYRMEQTEQKGLLAHSITYKTIDALVFKQFNRYCGKNKTARILSLLKQKKLIEKVGNYKVGLRGNCYRITSPVAL